MRTLEGRSSGAFTPILGEAVLTRRPFYTRAKRILVTTRLDWGCLGYAGCVTEDGTRRNTLFPDAVTLLRTEECEHLHAGDILRMNDTGSVTVLWEQGSAQNALMLTEACNCHCRMCPQPPQEHDPALLREAHSILDLLRGKEVSHIGITGGEPTLLRKDFVKLLRRCTTEHPQAVVNVLTNGKALADKRFAAEVATASSVNTVFCVSLHADIDTLHDTIVGCRDSFQATQRGLYAMAEQGARLEIRHVISKLNYNRLPYFAEHVYKYFPFCVHYAFMGMEICGQAEKYMKELYISPLNYKEELMRAIIYLHRRGLSPSVYNIPLCLCEPHIRPFARQSISQWKNIYLSSCSVCTQREACAGFFATSVKAPLEHIHPIKELI